LALPGAEPEPECLRGALGQIGERRVLVQVLLFGERSLRRALSEYVDHYHEERNHQGKGNVLLFPRNRDLDRERRVQCRERLGGLLRYYHQEAA
jgi:putative transposase